MKVSLAFVLLFSLFLPTSFSFAQIKELSVKHKKNMLDTGDKSGSGGGDVKPSKIIGEDTENLVSAIESARPQLLAYLYEKCLMVDLQWKCNFDQRFSVSKIDQEISTTFSKIIPEILKTGVTMMNDTPCYNSTHEIRDGSQYIYELDKTRRDGVCISLPLLASKFTAEDLGNKPIALVAHEYAHLVGADEELAQKIEAYISSVFLNDYQFGYHGNENLLSNLKEVQKNVNVLYSALENSLYSNIDKEFSSKEQFENLLSNVEKIYNLISPAPKYYELSFVDHSKLTDKLNLIDIQYSFILDVLWQHHYGKNQKLPYEAYFNEKPLKMDNEEISLSNYCEEKRDGSKNDAFEAFRVLGCFKYETFDSFKKINLNSFHDNQGLIDHLQEIKELVGSLSGELSKQESMLSDFSVIEKI